MQKGNRSTHTISVFPLSTCTIIIIVSQTVVRPSPYLRCLLLARVDARQEVLRTPKGFPVMARHLRVGTACLGMELVLHT